MATRPYTIILLCALLISASLCFGQKITRKGKIIDEVTKQPLSFVNIILKGKPIGTFSDEVGSFKIQGDVNDSLQISHIGYVKRLIPFKVDQELISLSPQSNLLNEVIITSPGKIKEAILGFFEQKSSVFMGGVFQYALYIENKSQTIGRVKTLYFKLGHSVNRAKSDKREAKVRLRIYERDSSTGVPGIDVLKKEFICAIKPNQKLIKIDVSKENIPFLQDGIFIGIDVLGFTDDNGTLVNYHISDVKKHLHIPLTTKFSLPFTYVNPDGQEWTINKTFNPKSGRMEIANACFGVEVEF